MEPLSRYNRSGSKEQLKTKTWPTPWTTMHGTADPGTVIGSPSPRDEIC